MSLPIHCLYDDEGVPRAVWRLRGPAESVLPEFLEMDLGFDTSYARRLLRAGRQVRSGRLPAWEASGNAFAVSLGPEETVVEPLSERKGSGPVAVPTADFLRLVKGWVRMIEGEGETPGG